MALAALVAAGCAVAGEPAPPERRVRAPDAGVAAVDAAVPGQLVLPGPVDPGFGTRGIVAFPVAGVEPRDMVVAPDGKIVVVGSIFVDASSSFEGYVFRFLPDGSLDESFAGDGVHRIDAKNPYAASVALAPGGGIVVGGSCDCEAPGRIWRLRDDGALDDGFAAGGVLVLGPEASFIDDLTVDADGTIRGLGLALTDGLYAARVTPGGRVEHEGAVPVGDFYLHAAAPRPDGSWLLAGNLDDDPHGRLRRTTNLARLAPDGTLDSAFGFVAIDADQVDAARLAGERLLLGSGTDGAQRVEARRLDGSLDPSFGQTGIAELGRAAQVYAILTRADGALDVVTGDDRNLTIHRRRADGAAAGEPWKSTLPKDVWLDHLVVATDPRSGALLAAAVQHHPTVDAQGNTWWMVAGTGLVRISP